MAEKKKNRNDQLNDALDDLDIERKELDDKLKIDAVMKKGGSDEKILSLTDLSDSYKYTLQGKELDEGEGVYKQTGKSIAGNHFIRLACGTLESFSKQSNLISSMDDDLFIIKFTDAFEKVNNLAFRDETISEKDQRMVMKLFKDKLWNIGNIITNNKGNMEAVMQRIKEIEEKMGERILD